MMLNIIYNIEMKSLLSENKNITRIDFIYLTVAVSDESRIK